VEDDVAFVDGGALLERQCGRYAAYVVSLGRDESDNYALAIDRKKREGVTVEPSPGELSSLLPVGSHWVQALGWRSFVGMPLVLQGGMWLAVGVEGVGRHAKGGAFARFRAMFLQWPLDVPSLEALWKVAEELCPRDEGQLVRYAPLGIANIKTTSTNWEEHRHMEGRIIRRVVNDYGRRKLTLFRTLIICEDEVRRDYRTWRMLKARGGRGGAFLTATVDEIRRTFSFRCRKRLSIVHDREVGLGQ